MTARPRCPACRTDQKGRFCPACGAPLTGSAAATNWMAGGMAFVVAATFLLAPLVRGTGTEGTGSLPPVRGLLGPATSSTASRESADQLFDRVIAAAESGDSVAMARFLPMAILAYQEAAPLDADGLFHLSTLLRESDQVAQAGAAAGEALAANPRHLLGLYAAARAARRAGDLSAAGEFYSRIIEAWEREMRTGAPEYEAHAGMLAAAREEAERFLQAG